MRQAVIYARYSPGGSQTYQSIEGQLTVCRKFAADNDLSIAAIYEDEHLTGRNDQRPKFQKMLKDSVRCKWDIVLVYALDRFGRNSIEIAINKYHLQKQGKTVISATQRTSTNVDGSKNLDGILLENMYIGLAEYYSEELSQKVTRGLRESYAKGNFTGGHVLFGYKVVIDERTLGEKKERKLLALDEDKAPIMRFIFEEYAKGTSKDAIVQELTRRGYKNTKGKPLKLSSFQYNLTNKKYIGEFEHEGVVYTDIYPPLIDKATFERAQKRLARRRHAPAALKARQEYILQGKAFCGHCGARLVGVGGTGKLGTMYYYYACGKRCKEKTCDKRAEKKEELEQLIVELVLEYVLDPARANVVAERIVAMYKEEFNTGNVVELERRIAKIDEEIEKAVNAFLDADGLIRKSLNAKVKDLEAQKLELQNDIDGLKAGCAVGITKELFLSWLNTFAKGDPEDKDFQKRVVDALLNCVYIYDDKYVLYFNMQDGEMVTFIEHHGDVEDVESWENLEKTQENAKSGAKGVRISTPTPRQVRRIRTLFRIRRFLLSYRRCKRCFCRCLRHFGRSVRRRYCNRFLFYPCRCRRQIIPPYGRIILSAVRGSFARCSLNP
jgi:DNA invertase Pin-like site-specific DNA recombinase